MINTCDVVVGQKMIYKGDMANASGRGAVVAIRVNARAGRMYSIDWGKGQMVEFDSSKSFDIVLDDGRRMNGVYASNIGGGFNDKTCRFMVDEGMASAEEISALLTGEAMRTADLKAKADETARVFAEAMDAATKAGKAIGLIPEAEFKKRGSAAAYNLRAELKAAGIKARVTQDGYSALRVKMETAEGIEQAKKIGAKYEAGSFDAMTDCYAYDPSAWGKVFGDVRYVFVVSVEGYL